VEEREAASGSGSSCGESRRPRVRWVYPEGALRFGFDTAENVVVDRQNNVFASGFTNGGLDGNAGDCDPLVVKVDTSGRKR
jgi:hypothetical protein